MISNDESPLQLGRRVFLKNGVLLLTASAVTPARLLANQESKLVTVGLVTDMHYADKPPAGSRHYRETPAKLEEAADHFSRQGLDFLVELGDFIDAADSVDAELGYLKRINRDFQQICKQRHYVLGNHCVHTLTKKEFLGGIEQPRSYYSFDQGEFHFVVLDSCFRGDGEPYGRKNFKWTDPNVPDAELEWLAEDLKATEKMTVVFAHQRLDVSNQHGVRNAAQVRKVLEDAGNVLAVFQGHSHKNDHKDIGGIHYCTLVAMIEGSGIENSGYSTMTLDSHGTISIAGARKQADYQWKS